MELFRLQKFRIKDNDVFKQEIEFDFNQGNDSFSNPGPYFTLVIGPNGTGKSNVLKLIIDVFHLVYAKKNELPISYYPKGKYSLEYFLKDANYTVTNRLGWAKGNEEPKGIDDKEKEKGIRAFRNGQEIDFDEIKIPEAILALSIMLTDKFPVFKESSVFPIYQYLGVRRDSNTAGTRSYITKTIDYVLAASSRKTFIHEVKELLSFLELSPEFLVSYSPRYKHLFFKPDITLEFFEDFFTNNQNYLQRKTIPWSVNNFKSLKEKEPEVIPQLVELLKFLSHRLVSLSGSRSKYFEFNIFEEEYFHRGVFKLLPYLHKLDLISYPSITLKKKDHYSLENSSSGEYHFIATIISLLATVKSNSIVLIDEPEISLHPNWQMKYIHFLQELIKKYDSVHFIICTHSHFFVSDIKPENSSVLSLNKNSDGDIIATPVEANTYGWSAEEILYTVFNVRSFRNSYLEYDLTKLVSLLNKNSTDYNEIRRILNKIKELSLGEADPLKIIIEKAQKYVDKRNA